jgi:hypothetical protein
VVVREVIEGTASCDDGDTSVRGRFGFGDDASCSYRLTRRVSQPTPAPTTEGEFRVGDEVEGRWLAPERLTIRGRITELDSYSSILCARGTVVRDKNSGLLRTLDQATLRRLPAQPATEGKAEPKPKPCSHCDNPNCHSHKFPIDLYAEHRKREEAGTAPLNKAASVRAMYIVGRPKFTADQIGSIDLDRPLTQPRYPTRNRGACLGVMGIGEGVKRREGKGAPSTWPEGSDHE